MAILKNKLILLLSRLSLIVISVIIGLLIGEIVLRALNLQYAQFRKPDIDLGMAYIPKSSGWYNKEGRAFVRINSQGFRGDKFTLNKHSNIFRIAVIGDSYTAALQVPIEKSFPKILENSLSNCNNLINKEVEVLNFGVEGYGTAIELLLLQKTVLKYNSDIVLLAFFTGNDVLNNSKLLQKTPRPYFTKNNGKLILDDSYKENTIFKITNWFWNRFEKLMLQSWTFQLIYEAAHSIWYELKRSKRRGSLKQEIIGDEQGISKYIYFEPIDDNWSKAWDVTEAIILEMKKIIESQSKEFWIVTLSNSIQVHPNDKVRKNFEKRIKVENLLYPDQRIRKFAINNNIPVITLVEKLRKYAVQNRIFLHGFENTQKGFGHWNKYGHLFAGKEISKQMCDALKK